MLQQPNNALFLFAWVAGKCVLSVLIPLFSHLTLWDELLYLVVYITGLHNGKLSLCR